MQGTDPQPAGQTDRHVAPINMGGGLLIPGGNITRPAAASTTPAPAPTTPHRLTGRAQDPQSAEEKERMKLEKLQRRAKALQNRKPSIFHTPKRNTAP
ncbi:hypothetical protein HRG_006520 [Hirsutella rhossiliensis]|uniref:Uncharacterized protein n=1 Tax=Hirsutella rhossiliensis TaxID=111463 RepID=A0A9P8SGT8_9HYPO|nr:uncharacterized protein HRG_06520 [Hirsutella rhossiliensis]KAH0962418.1 hypothetical protein HRG_06520 [Hirsutella rhossiliensis]